jgi:hypothetical protein
LKNVANLINCQIAYLLTLWKHDAVLPEFLNEGCLKKDGLGNIQFDFGGDVRVQKLEDLLTIDESELRVRMNEASLTSKRKRQDTTPSQPGTRRKKKPIMSTPM